MRCVVTFTILVSVLLLAATGADAWSWPSLGSWSPSSAPAAPPSAPAKTEGFASGMQYSQSSVIGAHALYVVLNNDTMFEKGVSLTADAVAGASWCLTEHDCYGGVERHGVLTYFKRAASVAPVVAFMPAAVEIYHDVGKPLTRERIAKHGAFVVCLAIGAATGGAGVPFCPYVYTAAQMSRAYFAASFVADMRSSLVYCSKFLSSHEEAIMQDREVVAAGSDWDKLSIIRKQWVARNDAFGVCLNDKLSAHA